MNFTDFTTILLAGASICLGALFGALPNKILASKGKTNLHYAFYVISILVFFISIATLFFHWQELFSSNWFGIVVFGMGFTSSVILFLFSWKVLVIKNTFHSSELDSIINAFI